MCNINIQNFQEFCQPKPEKPNEGFLVPNVELPPLCSSRFRPGPPSDQAQVTTKLLADIINNSACIKLEDLCITKEKLAWCLYADLFCLDYDGAVIDACVIALISALKTGKYLGELLRHNNYLMEMNGPCLYGGSFLHSISYWCTGD